MAFLVRMVLEEADSLESGIEIFRKNPRTCEYYFVIADGNHRQGRGHGSLLGHDWRDRHGREPSQVAARASKTPSYSRPATAIRHWSSASKQGLGTFDAESARHLMDRPVAMKSNLHSVLFETTTTRFWVANASKDGKPAAEQPYHAFNLRDLLAREADAGRSRAGDTAGGSGELGPPLTLADSLPDH